MLKNVPDTQVSIIIPTWNHRDLLGRCLKAADAAARECSKPVEILVVDDGSEDGTREFVAERYSAVRIIALEHNIGFGPAVNIGVQQAVSPLVFLLNNDIIVEPGFLSPLVSHFEEPTVFAVAPRMISNGNPTGGRTVGNFRMGFLNLELMEESKATYNLLVGGGAGLFRRDHFIALDGFDSIFWPFYYEDLDLCYRAWKRGWRLLYEPHSIVYHNHGSTIHRRFDPDYVRDIGQRNMLLFHWKNISNQKWLFQHFCFLLFRIIKKLLKLDFKALRYIYSALRLIGPVAQRRREEKLHGKLRDNQVLLLVKNNKGLDGLTLTENLAR